jgi:hypothetical protein
MSRSDCTAYRQEVTDCSESSALPRFHFTKCRTAEREAARLTTYAANAPGWLLVRIPEAFGGRNLTLLAVLYLAKVCPHFGIIAAM